MLSGYVISATLRPNETGLYFAIRRISRIYSVAVPAIFLSWAIDSAVTDLNIATVSHGYQLGKPWAYISLALTFSGDSWNLAEPVFSNGAYWSLNYEVWYYVAFGITTFARGAWRITALFLMLAMTGLKLWLLFPVWLGGVMVARLQQVKRLPKGQARLLVAASMTMIVFVKVYQCEQPINDFSRGLSGEMIAVSLRYSQWFLGDYLIGGLTMALVYALGSAEVRFPRFLRQPIVGLASVSFSLYLLHGPLLMLFEGLLPGHGLLTILLSLAFSLALGALIEPQKDSLRRMLTWLLGYRAARS